MHLPNGKKIAVECDGDRYHEGDALQNDIERQLILERAKWEFFRVRWSHYKYAPEEALEKLWVLLEKRSGEIAAKRVSEPRRDTESTPIPPEKQLVSGEPTGTFVLPREEENGKETPRPFASREVQEEWDNEPVDLLIFTDQARVYRQTGLDEADVEGFSLDGQLLPGEREIYRVATVDYSGFMIFCYSNGKVDRVSLSAYKASRSVLQNAYHKEQKLLLIRHFQSEADLAGITNKHKVIVFSTGLVSEHSSRGNQGNQVFKTGSQVKNFKLLEDARLSDPEYYRRNTTNARGYYLKEGDRV